MPRIRRSAQQSKCRNLIEQGSLSIERVDDRLAILPLSQVKTQQLSCECGISVSLRVILKCVHPYTIPWLMPKRNVMSDLPTL
ncbi:hypothetical protein TNCV_3888571 [Trichonephila clavipes]|nr:hypothetical protein TNCV_3888571 [Trichonephila clavipes]